MDEMDPARRRWHRDLAAALLITLCAATVSAATRVAASCESADVQAAINQAQDGDTVSIPAGTCTWSVQVSTPIGKGLRIQGAGIGQTVLTRSTAIPSGMLFVRSVGAGIHSEVTGITFDWSLGTHPTAARSIQVDAQNTSGTFRIHHNAFVNMQRRGIFLNADGVVLSGLIDHNTFASPTDSRDRGVAQAVAHDNCNSGFSAEDAVLDAPLDFGSDDAVFFEDNALWFATLQDGGYEGYGCVRMVVRFNAFHGASQSLHGTEGQRGTQSYVFHNNTFDVAGMTGANCTPVPNSSCWTGRVHHIRSGTGFVFNNTYDAMVDGGFQYYIYRAVVEIGSDGHYGPTNNTVGTLTTAGADCAVASRCHGWPIGHLPNYPFVLNVGTSGTFHFEASADATSLATGTWTSVGTATADGYQNISNDKSYTWLRVRASAINGSATVRPSIEDCDGGHVMDGNLGSGLSYPARGYPCVDQPGWYFNHAAGNDGTFTLTPAYSWNNIRNGVLLAATAQPTAYLAANVDFYDGVSASAQTSATSPFNGTVGVGHGVSARRPPTCTTGVGYWATDEGEWNSTNGPVPDGRFYRCVTTDIWMLHYTPYRYPHPLASPAKQPVPPSNIRIRS